VAKRQIDPVDAMLDIGKHFLDRSKARDELVEEACEDGAEQREITVLMDLADSDRLRALHAFQLCAGFIRSKLQAIECVPPAPETVDRFRQAIDSLTEDEILYRIRRVEGGASALALLEVDNAN
jgi:hypothetical protein